MNKTLKVVLIALVFIALVGAIFFLPKLIINKWSNSFIPPTSSNSEVCSEKICNRLNADNSFYNESSSICICYKQGQIVKQTQITSN